MADISALRSHSRVLHCQFTRLSSFCHEKLVKKRKGVVVVTAKVATYWTLCTGCSRQTVIIRVIHVMKFSTGRRCHYPRCCAANQNSILFPPVLLINASPPSAHTPLRQLSPTQTVNPDYSLFFHEQCAFCSQKQTYCKRRQILKDVSNFLCT